MEGRGVAAAAVALCCVLIMLSGQQQVAGLPEFCGCYRKCYPVCNKSHPWWICTAKCVQHCAMASQNVPAAAFDAGDCSKICLTSISICGAAAADADEGPTDAGVAAAACVHDCTNNWS